MIDAKAEPLSDKPEEKTLPEEIVVNDDYIESLLEEAAKTDKSSKQILLEDACRIIPRLNRNLIDLITVWAFVLMIFPRNRLYFEKLLGKVAELGTNVFRISSVDVALLKHLRCVEKDVSIYPYSVEKQFSESYDAYFRKSVQNEQVLALLRTYPEYVKNPNYIRNTPVEALFDNVGYLGKEWYYKLSSNNHNYLYNKALKNEKDAKLVKAFDQMAIKMTEAEIKDSLMAINEKWGVISFLFMRDFMKQMVLTPIGYYIGLCWLCKQTGENVSFTAICLDN